LVSIRHTSAGLLGENVTRSRWKRHWNTSFIVFWSAPTIGVEFPKKLPAGKVTGTTSTREGQNETEIGEWPRVKLQSPR
jgi:hypothetical protein